MLGLQVWNDDGRGDGQEDAVDWSGVRKSRLELVSIGVPNQSLLESNLRSLGVEVMLS